MFGAGSAARACGSAAGSPPAAIAPRRDGVVLAADVRGGIIAAGAPGMAAGDPGQGEPEPAPGPVQVDGVERILRARRQMPAVTAHEPRQGIAVEVDGSLEQLGSEPHASVRPDLEQQRRRLSPSRQPGICLELGGGPASSTPRAPMWWASLRSDHPTLQARLVGWCCAKRSPPGRWTRYARAPCAGSPTCARFARLSRMTESTSTHTSSSSGEGVCPQPSSGIQRREPREARRALYPASSVSAALALPLAPGLPPRRGPLLGPLAARAAISSTACSRVTLSGAMLRGRVALILPCLT